MSKKFAGATTHYGNWQHTPFFSTVQEVRVWCEENDIKIDIVMPIANWEEMIRWQNDPSSIYYREQGAWQVAS